MNTHKLPLAKTCILITAEAGQDNSVQTNQSSTSPQLQTKAALPNTHISMRALSNKMHGRVKMAEVLQDVKIYFLVTV